MRNGRMGTQDRPARKTGTAGLVGLIRDQSTDRYTSLSERKLVSTSPTHREDTMITAPEPLAIGPATDGRVPNLCPKQVQ